MTVDIAGIFDIAELLFRRINTHELNCKGQMSDTSMTP